MPDITPQVTQLNMNGLRGRMKRWVNQRSKKQFLVLYDLGGSLERISQLALLFHRFGTVTAVDLPGMGGMDAFRSLHRKPTIDTYAEYMAAFITLRYRHTHLVIIAQPFSFAFLTRMLQKYPKVAARVDLVISWGGFVHFDDWTLDSRKRNLYRLMSYVGSSRLSALLLRAYYLRAQVFHQLYPSVLDSGRWLMGDELSWRESRLQDMRDSDIPSCVHALRGLLTLDNCQQQLATPLSHVITRNRLFDENRVDQHLRVAYASVATYRLGPRNALPAPLRRLLAKA